MNLNESTITLRMGTMVVLLSVLVATVSGATTYAFTYGYTKRDREAQIATHDFLQKEIDVVVDQIKELRKDTRLYTDTEVGGLRADWERELNRK